MEPLTNEERLIEAGWAFNDSWWEHPHHGKKNQSQAILTLPVLPLLAEIANWESEAKSMASRLQEARTASKELNQLTKQLIETERALELTKAQYEDLKIIFKNQNEELLQAWNLLYRKGQLDSQERIPKSQSDLESLSKISLDRYQEFLKTVDAIYKDRADLANRISNLESDMCEIQPGGSVALKFRIVLDTPPATSEPESPDKQV